ncbi:hypothetical protein EV359DRAFT_87980 [Lentinula novae-zelandiae]|nr:hypothetical protein EV359DRAFT_87980 [Lentinula novae-zelandiae]
MPPPLAQHFLAMCLGLLQLWQVMVDFPPFRVWLFVKVLKWANISTFTLFVSPPYVPLPSRTRGCGGGIDDITIRRNWALVAIPPRSCTFLIRFRILFSWSSIIDLAGLNFSWHRLAVQISDARFVSSIPSPTGSVMFEMIVPATSLSRASHSSGNGVGLNHGVVVACAARYIGCG